MLGCAEREPDAPEPVQGLEPGGRDVGGIVPQQAAAEGGPIGGQDGGEDGYPGPCGGPVPRRDPDAWRVRRCGGLRGARSGGPLRTTVVVTRLTAPGSHSLLVSRIRRLQAESLRSIRSAKVPGQYNKWGTEARSGTPSDSAPKRRAGRPQRQPPRSPPTNAAPLIIAYPRSELRRSTCRTRRISESAVPRELCSNCALSPAPQRACRSGRDSQLFSFGGGTPRTRDGSLSQ